LHSAVTKLGFSGGGGDEEDDDGGGDSVAFTLNELKAAALKQPVCERHRKALISKR
jgi:hypothetical protein